MKRLYALPMALVSLVAVGCGGGSSADTSTGYTPKPLPRNGWSTELAALAYVQFVEGTGMEPNDFTECAFDYVVDNHTPADVAHGDQEAMGYEAGLTCAHWMESPVSGAPTGRGVAS